MTSAQFAAAAADQGIPAHLAALLVAASDPFEPTLERLRAASLSVLYLDAVRRGLVEQLDTDGTTPWVLVAAALGTSVAEARVIWGPEHTQGLSQVRPAR